uniref:Uncharacterized protein n=1 Tax=Amphimedon queenslandica TaxID=400682 RepID=A0A1X7U2F9_AMPQE
MHQGHNKCRVMFLKLHTCCKSRFEEIMKNCRMNRLILRVHGNAGKTPNHALLMMTFQGSCVHQKLH